MKAKPFYSRRIFLRVALAVACGGTVTAVRAASEGAQIIAVVERVADWQLSHPCSFDISWRSPNNGMLQQARIEWDGTVQRRREVPAGEPIRESVAPNWGQLVTMVGDQPSWVDLPEAVRRTCRERLKISSADLSSLAVAGEAGTRGWEMATFYRGMAALAATVPQTNYLDALRLIATANQWQLGPRIYHADDQAVGSLYLDLFARDRRLEMLVDTQARLDWIMAHPSSQRLDIRAGQERWTWCDALFMAPPVWQEMTQLTGDVRYLEFMDREWWATVDRLYAKDERLFFRDANFVSKREANGAKVFWSRGNGWVLAALAMIVPSLPENWPASARYGALFRELTARMVELQPAEGLWHSSLLDPAAYPEPEASASALVCYALARGVNQGLLDRTTYEPIVWRTWAALQHCVRSDGLFGYVQQPGAAPRIVGADSTASYGVGAFLLAGSEVFKLAEGGRR